MSEPRRLRVVSVCRTLPNPDSPFAGVFVARRLEALAELTDLEVIQPVPYLPGLRPLPDWALEPRTLNGLTIRHAPMLYVPGILKSTDARCLARAIGPIVARLHREQAVNVLDAHFGYPDGAGCVRVARQLGLPVFITMRGFENDFIRRGDVGPQLIAALRTATGCVSVSHSLKELAVAHGVDSDRVRVVHNAIDTALFHPGDRGAARRDLDIDPAVPLIVSVGNLVSGKRHHVLVEAFARVLGHYPGARLVIIGATAFEPGYPVLLRAQIQKFCLSEHVQLLGNIAPAAVGKWLRAANLFALATEREGCCNAVLEALATGLPVVTTPAGDNRYFVDGATNGTIVPVDDVAMLASALKQALARSDWNPMVISSQLVGQVGSWRRVAEAVLGFFDERLHATGAL